MTAGQSCQQVQVVTLMAPEETAGKVTDAESAPLGAELLGEPGEQAEEAISGKEAEEAPAKEKEHPEQEEELGKEEKEGDATANASADPAESTVADRQVVDLSLSRRGKDESLVSASPSSSSHPGVGTVSLTLLRRRAPMSKHSDDDGVDDASREAVGDASEVTGLRALAAERLGRREGS